MARIKKTHCRRGHELAGDNAISRKDGYRDCRACRVITDSDRRAGGPRKKRVRIYRSETTVAELAAIAEGCEIRSERDERRIEMVIFRWLDLIDRANTRKYKRELAA